MSEIIGACLLFGFGYLVSWIRLMDALEERHPETFVLIKDENRTWWNELLNSWKLKTKEDQIKLLEEEIDKLKE